jgi:hypothetical protein
LGFPVGALNPYVFDFSRNMETPAGGMKSKGWAQDQCCEYFKDAPFDNEKGPLGTHSLGSTAQLTAATMELAKRTQTHMVAGRQRVGPMLCLIAMMIQSCHLWTLWLLLSYVWVVHAPM